MIHSASIRPHRTSRIALFRQVVTRHVPCYNIRIVIQHKGLRRILRAELTGGESLRTWLHVFGASCRTWTLRYGPGDMDIPGYRLPPLTGDRRDQWSVRVSGNWHIVFRFVDGVAADVDLIDYH